MNQKYVLITAGGAGVRMNSPLPKQFMDINGKPILIHTISRFLQYSLGINIVVVLPQQQISYWEQLCQQHHFSPPMTVVAGGATRFHSVRNGLEKVPHNALVAIHDGVRPLVSIKTIRLAFELAAQYGNAIPAIGINESIRVADNQSSKIIDRNAIRIVQTPQCFQSSLIKNAYNVTYMDFFTDDASVLEYAGEKILLVEGDKSNIKITSQEDLVIASALIRSELSPTQ